MTRDKARKRAVRERAAATGERYVVARRAVEHEHERADAHESVWHRVTHRVPGVPEHVEGGSAPRRNLPHRHHQGRPHDAGVTVASRGCWSRGSTASLGSCAPSSTSSIRAARSSAGRSDRCAGGRPSRARAQSVRKSTLMSIAMMNVLKANAMYVCPVTMARARVVRMLTSEEEKVVASWAER